MVAFEAESPGRLRGRCPEQGPEVTTGIEQTEQPQGEIALLVHDGFEVANLLDAAVAGLRQRLRQQTFRRTLGGGAQIAVSKSVQSEGRVVDVAALRIVERPHGFLTFRLGKGGEELLRGPVEFVGFRNRQKCREAQSQSQPSSVRHVESPRDRVQGTWLRGGGPGLRTTPPPAARLTPSERIWHAPGMATREPHDPRLDAGAGAVETKDTARNRDLVEAGFWPKFQRLAARLPFAQDLLAAYYAAMDSATPLRVRAGLLAALAYFVVPLDMVPDFVVALGYTDDAAVLIAALRSLSQHVRPAHRDQARAALAEILQPPAS